MDTNWICAVNAKYSFRKIFLSCGLGSKVRQHCVSSKLTVDRVFYQLLHFRLHYNFGKEKHHA